MLPHVGFVARHSSVHSSFHVTKNTSDQLIMIDSLNLVIFNKWSTLLNGLYLWQWSTTQQYSTLDLLVDTTTTTQRSCTPRTVHKWLAQLHCQTGWGPWPWASQQPVCGVLIRTLTRTKLVARLVGFCFFNFSPVPEQRSGTISLLVLSWNFPLCFNKIAFSIFSYIDW